MTRTHVITGTYPRHEWPEIDTYAIPRAKESNRRVHFPSNLQTAVLRDAVKELASDNNPLIGDFYD